MDKSTPVVQGFNLYVETVARKINVKNLSGEPLYALLGTKKARRKVLAGPYASMRDLMAEMLESNILDEEFISQFGSIILNAATMDEDGTYHFNVDIAECKPTDNAILVRFSLQAYINRNEIPDCVDIMPVLNFYRYGAAHGKYPKSMDEIDRFIGNAGEPVVDEDCLAGRISDIINALSAEEGSKLFAGKYLLAGYGGDVDDEDVVLSLPTDLIDVINMASAGRDIIASMLSETFSQLRIKKLSLNSKGNIEASTYVSIPLTDINTAAGITYALAEAVVNTYYDGNWDAAENDLGEISKQDDEPKSSIQPSDDKVLYFISGEYNSRLKPSETLFTSNNANSLAELIINAHGAIRLFIKEYDSIAVGIAIEGTALVKLAVFDKHQDDNAELATMAFTMAETMAYAQLCMDGCKYDVDLDGYKDLVRLTALSFASGSNFVANTEEGASDGEQQ